MSDTHGAPLKAVEAFLNEMAETMGVELPDTPTVKTTLPLLLQAARHNRELLAQWMGQKPIDMILFCPTCNAQHIDEPVAHRVSCAACVMWEGVPMFAAAPDAKCTCGTWTNPPHRTHSCRACGESWRPSDHATNGVLHLASNRPDEMKAPKWEPRTTIDPPAIWSDAGKWPFG